MTNCELRCGGAAAKPITEYSIPELEALYDRYHAQVIRALSQQKSAVSGIRIKAGNLNTLDNSELWKLSFSTPDQYLNAIEILVSNGLPFTECGKHTLTATWAGLAEFLKAAEINGLPHLHEVEAELLNRLNAFHYHDVIVRTPSDKPDQKWMVRDAALSNTYYFSNLSDLEEGLTQGLFKKTYEFVKLLKWGLPKTINPKKWEMPNTLRHVTNQDILKMTLIIDGADDMAVALNNSGLPQSLSFSLQSLIIYPLFLSVVNLGYAGGDCGTQEAFEELEEQREESRQLREALVASLTREFQFKSFLIQAMKQSRTDCSDPPDVTALHQLNQEAVIRQLIQELREELVKTVPDQARVKELKSQLNAKSRDANESVAGRRAKALNAFSDQDFLQHCLTNGRNAIQDPVVYASFIKELSAYKQVQDRLFDTKVSAWLTNQFLRSGMGIMWWSMALMESAALVNTIRSFSGNVKDDLFINTVGSSAGGLAITGQVLMMAFALADTFSGVKESLSIADWIKKIQQSSLIDADAKKQITLYLKNRRTNVLISKGLGSQTLSLGQLGLILGGGFGPFGVPATLAGAILTLMGVGIKFYANSIDSKRFMISPDTDELEHSIMRRPTAPPDFTPQPEETVLHTNLRWKAAQMLDLNRTRSHSLVWLKLFSNVHAWYSAHMDALPESEAEKQALAQRFIHEVITHYDRAYDEPLKKVAEEIRDTPAAMQSVAMTIDTIYQSQRAFYTLVGHMILNHNSANPETENIEVNPHHEDPEAVQKLIDFLKSENLWPEIYRKTVKELVIFRKQKDNIRGERFARYVTRIPARKNRYIYFPNPIPFARSLSTQLPKLTRVLDWKVRNPVFPYKKKTIYMFNETQFLADLNQYRALSPEIRNQLDAVLAIMFDGRKDTVGEIMFKDWKSKIKSDVYRPLWVHIPELVYQEDLAKTLETGKVQKSAGSKAAVG